MGKIELKAFAKINLSLDVVGRLDNGYHVIRSVMHAISLDDRVIVETGGAAGLYRNPSVKLAINADALNGQEGRSDTVFVPNDRQNTAWKAAMAMAEHFCPVAGGRIQIEIEKRIPVAAGLAGGSADAAAVILALAQLWDTGADLKSLMHIGAGVGADVPFCMAAIAANDGNAGFKSSPQACSAALAEGIGDHLTPLPSLAAAPAEGSIQSASPIGPGSDRLLSGSAGSIQSAFPTGSSGDSLLSGSEGRIQSASPTETKDDILLVKPAIAVSTARIYSLYDDFVHSGGDMRRPDTDTFVAALRRGGLDLNERAIHENMVNVLENITIKEYPVVNALIESIRRHVDSDHVLMSGSGPTVIAFFRGKRASSTFKDLRHDLELRLPIQCESHLVHLI